MELANSFEGFGRIGHRVQPYVSAREHRPGIPQKLKSFRDNQ